jgi:hypothetical protein
VVYNSSRLSAEWIVERPTVNGTISTLADFGNVTFTECKANINGTSGTINGFSFAQLVMHGSQDQPLVSVTSLSVDGSSFTVSYLEPPEAASQNNNLQANSFAAFPLESAAFRRKPYA